MANYITNILKVNGKEQVTKVKELLVDKDGKVDFNILLPQPKELDIESGCGYGYSSDGKHSTDLQKEIQLTMEQLYKDSLTQAEFVDIVLDETVNNPYFHKSNGESFTDREVEQASVIAKGFYNYRKYSYTDWYDFRNKVWGTKWNAFEESVSEFLNGEKLVIVFDTAWSTPYGVWEALSKKGIDFTVAYADEDIGYNLGILESNGKELSRLDNFNTLTLEEKQTCSLIIKYGTDEWTIEQEMADMELQDDVSVQRRIELSKELEQYV